jgi:hypothetical protein
MLDVMRDGLREEIEARITLAGVISLECHYEASLQQASRRQLKTFQD